MKYTGVVVALTLVSNVFSNTCDRSPKKADNPKPNNNRYVIEVSGNPTTYSPGHNYTIILKSSPSNPTAIYFTEFMLVVEPESPLEALHNVQTGDLRPLDQSIAVFTSRCPNAIVQTNNLAKSRVEILWTAPPSGNGCVAVKAMVYESSDSWFSDDGGLTVNLCEEEENPNDQPAVLEECCACYEAKYEVAFQGLWTRNTHPNEYPPNMWTTKLGEVIGASHKYSNSFWSYDSEASEGIKLLAEEGNTSRLEDELKEMLKNDNIRTIIKARELSYPNITGTSYTVFRVDQEHHLISLISKITPSPDWVIGVANLELCTPDCQWIHSRTLNLYPWDVGTDDGTTYTASDSPSDPQKAIKMITSDVENTPFYDEAGEAVKPLAKLLVTRQKTYEKICEPEGEKESEDLCELGEWGIWSSCTTTCGQEMRTRDRKLLKPENEDSCKENGRVTSEQSTEKCTTSNECEENACSRAVWDDWSPCSVTCGNGVRTRSGKSSSEENNEDQKSISCSEEVECYNAECETEMTTERGAQISAESQTLDSVDCKVSRWSDWSPCSAQPCGRGFQYKYRSIEAQPQNGGNPCPKKLEKSKRCNIPCTGGTSRRTNSRTVDCKMGEWSEWSPCSKSCGSSAVQLRTRAIEAWPTSDGKPCGSRVEQKKCPLPYACDDRELRKLVRH